MSLHEESQQSDTLELQRHRFWHTPAVRHLAWLCGAPSLVDIGPEFSIADHLPDDTLERLLALDHNPEPLLTHLKKGQSQRLGHYFERLFHFALVAILEWPVLLRNTPVRDSTGRTLGELDFVVRNPLTGQSEHIEVAVKFYLGYVVGGETVWFGPNSNDRLDLKTRRMVDHQCRMTERDETRLMLSTHQLDGPVTTSMALPGNLFHPVFGAEASPPDWTNIRHERGYWIRHRDLARVDTSGWTPLIKPHWLGSYQTRNSPDTDITTATLNAVVETNRPRLFARLEARPDKQGYQEAERYFVVPEIWPMPLPK